MRMTATFPKSRARGCVAVLEWPDGSAATTSMHGSADRLPHDLQHYFVEAQFRPPYGFWNLAAQQAPFGSFTLVRGRWPRGRQDWLARVRRKHGVEMLKAESVGLAQITDPNLDMDQYWPVRARTLRKAYSYTAANPFANATKTDFVEARDRALALHAVWRRVPFGGALIVSWPPGTPPRILPTYEASGVPDTSSNRHRATRHRVRR